MDIQESIQMNEHIEDYLVRNFEFDSPFFDHYFNLNKCSESMKRVFDFLFNKVNFIYGCKLLEENPFELFAYFVTGERTLGFTDLTDSDIDEIEQIIVLSDNPIIKGRFYDICGIKKKDKRIQLLAADNYINYVKSNLLQGKNHSLYCSFERAIYLYSKNDSKKFWLFLDESIFDIQYKNKDQKMVFFYYILQVFGNLNKEVKPTYIPEFEDMVADVNDINDPALEIIRYLITYFKKKKIPEKLNLWRNKYADLCIEIDKSHPYCYNYLKKAIECLDPTSDADKINQLRFLLDDSYKRTYSQMNMVEHKIDNDIIKKIDEFREIVQKKFDEFTNGATQLLFFINSFIPVSKDEFEKHLKTHNGSLFNCVNNILFDDKGSIVYESATASDGETLEYLMSECMTQHFEIIANVYFYVWQKDKKVDNELKEFLKTITRSNVLISNDRSNIVYNILLKGLTDNSYRTCVFDLLAQFENGCRLYLKNYCKLYPTIIKGGQAVNIDLNHMLVQKGSNENKFRQKIAELIGFDLTTNIEYLACRRLTGNLRNNNYHSGYGDIETYTLNEVTLFFMLLKAYCMGYD